MHHVAHFLVYNVLAKFQLFCVITCRDILYFVFWPPYCHTLRRHQYLIYIMQKSWISLEREEIWQKGKCYSSSLLKAFQILSLFFNSSIFHFIGTLNHTGGISFKYWAHCSECKPIPTLLKNSAKYDNSRALGCQAEHHNYKNRKFFHGQHG